MQSTAGTTIPLFSKRTFTFTNVVGATTMEVPLIKAIDVTEWTQGTLIVRVHSATIATAGSKLDVMLKTTAPTPEDPALDFLVVPASAVASATIDQTVANNDPCVVVAQLSSGFGNMLQLSIQASQVTSSTTMTAALSAMLVMRA
jgi:hypothetical protein